MFLGMQGFDFIQKFAQIRSTLAKISPQFCPNLIKFAQISLQFRNKKF